MSFRSTLFFALAFLCLCELSSAQKIVYVRASGNDASDGSSESQANQTIAGAVADAVSGDILDVGPGTFNGSMIPYSLTIKGANSGAALDRWSDPTIIRSPFVLATGESPVEVTFDGVTFGQIIPVTGKSPNAIVSLANCMFNASKAVSTADLEWSEIVVVGCMFKGKMKDAATAESALNVAGVSVAYIAESYYSGYSKEAISISAVSRLLKLQYNEFTDCNSSGASNKAAIMYDIAGQDVEAEIQKNLIANCKHGIQTSGTVTGRTVSVQYNKFVRIPTLYAAITHVGSGSLNASCNAIELPKIDPPLSESAKRDQFSKLFIGQIEAFPLNDKAEDVDGAAVGFEPNKSDCSFSK